MTGRRHALTMTTRVSRMGFTLGIAAALVGAPALASPARAADAWTQQGSTLVGTTAGDSSGWAVAMSADGTTLAVGAPQSAEGGTDAGQVRVYEWDGSNWNDRGDPLNGAAGEHSGSAVALSADGTVLAVGAPLADIGVNADAGQVRVYEWDGSDWNDRGSPLSGDAALGRSGLSVALSSDGDVVAIGAPMKQIGADTQAGQVRTHQWDGSSWRPLGTDIDGGATDEFTGWSVDLSADGTTLAVGAPQNGDRGFWAGQVRVYSLNGSAWDPKGTLDPDGALSFFGVAVALSTDGDILAVGAPATEVEGVSVGQVRIYSWNGSAWIDRGDPIDGIAEFDYTGVALALSADGSTVAVGAHRLDDSNAGQVRVHTWDGNDWSPLGGSLDGAAVGDRFGGAVAISAAGTTVAIGAERADSRAGQVQVFTWPSSGVITGPVTFFSFVHADGRECTAISPQQVQVGTMVELPGVDALCQTMPGSTVAGWTIPVPEGFTGYGSSIEPFPPGLMVRVIESQTFTLVPFEPILQIDYDTNIATADTCTPADLAHTSDDGRIAHVWVPRIDFTMARTPSQAPCTPDGHELAGWNTAGDGTGDTIEPGAPLPDDWADGPDNQQHLYAVWTPTP